MTDDLHHRLGRRQLGLHAFEKRMPRRLLNLLSIHDTVEHAIPGIVPSLAILLDHDDQVQSARLCDPRAEFVGKLKYGIFGEGHNFCGYHNLQMQIAYLRQLQHNHLPSGTPSILGLQALIEEAWDAGINQQGKIQTGGIRGTRKHVGTLEVQALFKLKRIPTRVYSFPEPANDGDAYRQLLDYVATFFDFAPNGSGPRQGILCTTRPPIYLQRPGHSMTIVGIECSRTGEKSLLVFDPAIAPAPSMRDMSLSSDAVVTKRLRQMLAPYRRGKHELERFAGFETLYLVIDE